VILLTIKRGEIYFAQLNPVMGSEQGGIRPVLVIQNNIGNQYSPTTIVLAITSQINKAKMPTHVEIKSENYGLEKDSVILAEQISTIDKMRLKQRIATLDEETMLKVNQALNISLGLTEI
jgi:mRNA interferase MazF